jgi:tetratricopeptide (TPR) repeat protein
MLAAGVIALATPAHAQLSDRIVHTIATAQSDLVRQYGDFLVDKGRSFEVEPGAPASDQRQMLLRRSSLYESLKDYGKAEADLTAAIQLTAPTADVYADRGYFYMRQGRYGFALADFTSGAQLEPGNARMRYAQGRAYMRLGDYKAAIDHYNEAIKLNAREPTFYLARAEAQVHLGQPRLALADYDRALEFKMPSTVDRYFAFVGRGYACLLLADNRCAITNFDSALEIDPRATDALRWRAYARELDGQINQALDDYERVSSFDPADRLARSNVQRLRSLN